MFYQDGEPWFYAQHENPPDNPPIPDHAKELAEDNIHGRNTARSSFGRTGPGRRRPQGDRLDPAGSDRRHRGQQYGQEDPMKRWEASSKCQRAGCVMTLCTRLPNGIMICWMHALILMPDPPSLDAEQIER